MLESTVESSTEAVLGLTDKEPIRVLHIDDDADLLKVAKQYLEMQGQFQVDNALSFKEAMGKMKKKTYDAIVSDYMIPSEDSLEFLKELRRKNNNIPFIIFTGKGREEVAIKALNLGADQYINKTGDPETVYGELAYSIRKAVKAKQAEERLRRSEQKFRNLFENARDVIALFDLKGNVTDINKVAEEYGFKRDEIIGQNMLKFVSKKHWSRLLKELSKLVQGKLVEGEIELITPKGKRIVEYRSNSIRRENKVVGFQTILRDITERRRVEDALRKSEEKYRSIIELAPDGIITVDMKGVITSVNSTFLRLTGYSKDEIVGKHFTKLGTLRARDIPKYLKMMSLAFRRKLPPPFEYQYVTKDGTVRWGEAHVGFLKTNGKITGFQVILREITERKRAEKADQESREKFERLFMNNPEATDYLDPDFHILNVNPRFTELFGYSLAEVKGKHINDVIVPKDKMEEAQDLDKKARKGYAYHDTVRKRKDGSLVPVSISAAPIIVEGKLVGTVGLYKDITQRKKAEEALKETLKKLEMTNEKLHVVGRLTRHDIRNKLSTVTGNVYLAKQKLSDGHEALKHLEEIELAVRQIAGILDFSENYEKLGVEELKYIDVEKTVKEAASLFSDLHNVKMRNECHGLKVLSDSLLRQLFYNLIDNSLKHGEQVSQIRVYYKAGKDLVKLVYEDDGVGIPEAEKEKIFMEGYGKGTGYGLYLIRKICEVYGWTIRETGKHSKGAQFTITIPKMSKSGKLLVNHQTARGKRRQSKR